MHENETVDSNKTAVVSVTLFFNICAARSYLTIVIRRTDKYFLLVIYARPELRILLSDLESGFEIPPCIFESFLVVFVTLPFPIMCHDGENAPRHPYCVQFQLCVSNRVYRRCNASLIKHGIGSSKQVLFCNLIAFAQLLTF
jgi:hypothetical protein